MLKTAFSLMSPAGARGRLSVLIFHRVVPDPDPLFPQEMDATRFDEVCGWLKSWFNVLPLDDAAARLKEGRLPSRAACITFDDGYADNCTVAMPILLRHGITATFFISTGFLDGGRMWNDTVIESIRLTPLPTLALGDLLGPEFASLPVTGPAQKSQAIEGIIGRIKYQTPEERRHSVDYVSEQAQVSPPTDLMMRSGQVREMRRSGMQIGAHTVSHPILASLDRTAATSEIVESKYALEQLLGERIGLFAYPNGKPDVDYKPESVDIVRELGFDAACSTRWAAAGAETDPLQIPRFTPWDTTRLRFGARLMGNLRGTQH